MEKDWWFWWKSRTPNKILWAVKAESYETKEDRNNTKNCFKNTTLYRGGRRKTAAVFSHHHPPFHFTHVIFFSLCSSCFLQGFNVSLSLLGFVSFHNLLSSLSFLPFNIYSNLIFFIVKSMNTFSLI